MKPRFKQGDRVRLATGEFGEVMGIEDDTLTVRLDYGVDPCTGEDHGLRDVLRDEAAVIYSAVEVK